MDIGKQKTTGMIECSAPPLRYKSSSRMTAVGSSCTVRVIGRAAGDEGILDLSPGIPWSQLYNG